MFVFYAIHDFLALDLRFVSSDPKALAERAIDQLKIQDWLANRIKAKKALIRLDSCESGALTAGHTRSRFDGSDAVIGRFHEAIGLQY